MTATVDGRVRVLTRDIGDDLLRELEGTWLLRGIVERDAVGDLTGEPYGAHPSGRLVYGPSGSMAVVIREYEASPAVAYVGEVVRTGRDRIRHVVHIGLPPFTEDQERYVRLEDGTSLVLATDAVGHARVELHWERG